MHKNILIVTVGSCIGEIMFPGATMSCIFLCFLVFVMFFIESSLSIAPLKTTSCSVFCEGSSPTCVQKHKSDRRTY